MLVKVRTAELAGSLLDWSVAQADGIPTYIECGQWFTGTGKGDGVAHYSPSTDWGQVGPLIVKYDVVCGPGFAGFVMPDGDPACLDFAMQGPDHLIASCRAIVAKLTGDVVMIPDELLNSEQVEGE